MPTMPGLLAAEQRAGQRPRPLLGIDDHADQRLIIAGPLALGLRDLDVALPRDHRGIDHVDAVEQRPQQAHQHQRRQRPGVEFGDVAFVLDRDALQAALGDLACEAAELFGQRHVGPQLRCVLRRDRRHVQRVDHGAGHQIIGHLLRDLERHVLLRLGRAGAQMGRADDLIHAEQGVVLAGSTAKTSSAAPATWPLSIAAFRSSSTIRPPRAQLMILTPLRVLPATRR